MKNADLPAMPIEINGFGQFAPEAHTGLTKREQFAAALPHLDFNFANELADEMLGRKVDWDSAIDAMKAAAELESMFRVIRADALLAELERTK